MDDCSADDTERVLRRVRGLRYLQNKTNIGFIRNCNLGAKHARGKYLVFLNNDTEVMPGWLQAMRKTFDEHDSVGVVGSKLMYGDGRLQEAGGIIWEDGSGWNWGRLQDPRHPRYNFVRDVDYVSGASLMVPRELFFQLGGFSERLRNSYYEDTWLAFAARDAGYRVLYQPKSVVVHHEGVTSGRDLGEGTKSFQRINAGIFFERWRDELRTHLPNGREPEKASDRRSKDHILVIDAHTPMPDRDAGSVNMVNLIRILAGSGRRVHFIPQTNFAYFGAYTDRLQSIGVECIYAPYYRSVEEYLTERGDMFSHIIVARTPIAEAVFECVESLAPRAAKIFYTVDLHGLRLTRAAEFTEDETEKMAAAVTLQRELDFVRRSDITVVLSEYEARYLEDRGHRNVAVLPLIHDYARPACPAPYEARHGVVFIGGFQHPPNVDAALWLCDEIWPLVRAKTMSLNLPEIKLTIVGSGMPKSIAERARSDVEPLGFLDSLEEVFGRSRLSVAPLRYGAGLKGKLATSLGYGLPTVGTSIAFEGMAEEGLAQIRICADTPEEIADEVVKLYYSDRQRWSIASAAGMDYVARHYSMAIITPQVEKLLDISTRASRERRFFKRSAADR